jgi:hypothetical protein
MFVAVLCGVSLSAVSAVSQENGAIDSAGEALRGRSQIPWYNAETDSLQPVELPRPRRELDWNLSWLAQPLNILLIVIAVILVLLLAWLIVKLVRERERGQLPSGRTQRDRMVTADRVEALPFLRDRTQHDLLDQARYHYEQGNYSEAIIYLYSYELVELDRFALVRLAKGKTNRQYLREAASVRPLAGLLELSMVTFEGVFFGRRPLDRAGFEACWNQLPQFESLVSQSQATA